MFDGKVKLIKATAATSSLLGTDGGYSSDTTFYWSNLTTCPSETTAYNQNNNIIRLADKKIIGAPDPGGIGVGCNIWKYSELNTTNLNTNYLNRIGLTWSNLIEDTTWKVSGHTSSNVTPSVMYTEEITNASKTYGPSDGTSKVGLMYASDYGFAADPSAWTLTMSSYNNTTVKSTNWIYMGLDEWTIIPESSESYRVFFLFVSGYIAYNNANIGYAVRPTMYLKASAVYNGGSGTASVPIRIKI